MGGTLCGGYYGAKVWGSNSKYRRTIWRCNEKYKGNSKCSTPHITDDEIKAQFLIAFNKLMGNRDEIISNCSIAQSVLCDCMEIDTKLAELKQEIEVIVELSRKAIDDNARVAQNQEDFVKLTNSYLDRHRRTLERIDELEGIKRERLNKRLMFDTFNRELASRPLVIEEFEERLWTVAVDKVTIGKDGGMMFRFRDGSEVDG